MYFEDFSIGQQIKINDAVIDKQQMLDFAKLYDPFPIHTDEEYAKKSRFGGLIAPGVMSFMTVWAKFVEADVFGDALVAGLSTKIQWTKPVYPGDILKTVVTVTRLEKRNDHNGIVETLMEVYNGDGQLVLTNVTESVISCK